MEPSIGTTRSLTTGLLVSVGLHAAIATALVRYGDRPGSLQSPNSGAEVAVTLPLPDPVDPPRDDPQQKRLRLGIEKSSVVTETWLGFSDPSEHSGPIASVEQAAMSLRAAGQPGPDQPAVAASDASQASEARSEPSAEAAPQSASVPAPATIPVEVASSTPSPSTAPATDLTGRAEAKPPAKIDAAQDARSEAASVMASTLPITPDLEKAATDERVVPADSLIVETDSKSQADPAPSGTESPRAGDPVNAEPTNAEPANAEASSPEPAIPSPDMPATDHPDQRSPAERAEESPVAAPRPLLPPQAPAAKANPAATPSVESETRLPKPQRVSGDFPGVLSDRESVAAALKEAVDVKPGRPAAAEGLEIKTTNPRWSVTTQLIASPRNPVVWIAFGRDGKVIDADFLNGENTGSRAVDEPLLQAVFSWRAKGVALDELPPADPKAAVRVILRITLRAP